MALITYDVLFEVLKFIQNEKFRLINSLFCSILTKHLIQKPLINLPYLFFDFFLEENELEKNELRMKKPNSLNTILQYQPINLNQCYWVMRNFRYSFDSISIVFDYENNKILTQKYFNFLKKLNKNSETIINISISTNLFKFTRSHLEQIFLDFNFKKICLNITIKNAIILLKNSDLLIDFLHSKQCLNYFHLFVNINLFYNTYNYNKLMDLINKLKQVIFL